MKKLVFAGLLGAAAIFSTACSDACESAANRISDRQKECGATVQEGDSNGDDVECTNSLATDFEKLADCIEKANCTQVKDNTWGATCIQ
jgi:hypothetical protein